MKYMVSIDVPSIDAGIRFYCDALSFVEVSRPVDTYAVLQCGDARIGLVEKAPGTGPAKNCDDQRRYDRHWTPVHIDFHVDDFEGVVSRAVQAGAICEDTFSGEAGPRVAFFCDPFGHGFCIIGNHD